MACEGAPEQARRLFEQAWDARRDDYDAAIAAHYVARHQLTPLLTLDWNTRAITHCERLGDDRASELLPSLYLNLADSLLTVGRRSEAHAAVERAAKHLAMLPSDGYHAFVGFGIGRLREKLASAADDTESN